MAVKYMPSPLSVVLVDVNAKVVAAWRAAFADTPEVRVARGSILAQDVDAWVTPTNSRGSMDGGVDAVIRTHLGHPIQTRVQNAIAMEYAGFLPVGSATCVTTGIGRPGFLISTPTMVQSAENVSDTMNVALACAAAFQAIHMQNAKQPGSITSVAIPGLGARTGRVPPRVCANLMWTGYTLFQDHTFASYGELRAVLAAQLGDVDTLPETERVRIQVPEPTPEPEPCPVVVKGWFN